MYIREICRNINRQLSELPDYMDEEIKSIKNESPFLFHDYFFHVDPLSEKENQDIIRKKYTIAIEALHIY